ARHEHLDAVGEAIAIGDPAAIGLPAADLRGGLDSANVASTLRDDVDDAEERIRPVERGARSPDHLDPVDEVDVDERLRPDARLVVDAVVEAMAVHEEEDAGVEVARPIEAADAQIVVVAIVGHEEAGHALEDLGERPMSVAADLLRGHDRDERGRLGGLLLELRDAVDRSDLLEEDRLLRVAR